MKLKLIKKKFRRQQDQTDCGVACLISLVRYYGGSTHFEQVRQWSGTTKEGTTLLGLHEGATKLNFEAKGVQADMAAVRMHKTPVILHLLIENKLEHYVVFYGEQNGEAVVGDPAKGVLLMPFDELDKLWHSKKCLLLQPNDKFELKSTYLKKKINWLKGLVIEDYQLLMVAFVIGAVIAILGLAMSVFNQILLDTILPSETLSKVLTAILLLAMSLLMQAIMRVVRQTMLLKQGLGFNLRIMQSFLGRLLQMPKSFFDNRKTGDFVARLNDTAGIQHFITQVIGNFAIESLILLTALGAQFFYLPELALVSIIFMIIYAVVLIWFQPRLEKAQRTLMENYAHTESIYINSLQGIEAIKNRALSHHFLKRNMNTYKDFQKSIYSVGNISIHLGFVAELFGILYLLSVLSVGIWAYFSIDFTIGKLVAVLSISGMIVPSLSKLILTTVGYQKFAVAFDRLFELHSQEIEQQNGETINSITNVEIKDVSYRFAGRKALFSNVSLTLKRGELVGLLGENGSGKSTLINLLQGFYNVSSGTININSINIDELQIEQLRTQIGVVPQHISIFNDTMFFNLTGEELSDKSLKLAEEFWNGLGFNKFFKHLSYGLLTTIGEEAVRLSGGQKQMLSVARAIYHKPSLLILDEPTAAMDREAETFVFEILSKMKQSVAVLLITHRVHVIRKFADGIYLLESGELTPRQQHADLMKYNNIYSYYMKELTTP